METETDADADSIYSAILQIFLELQLRENASLEQELSSPNSNIATKMVNLLQCKLSILEKRQIITKVFSEFIQKKCLPQFEGIYNLRNFVCLTFYLISQIHDSVQSFPHQQTTLVVRIRQKMSENTSLFDGQIVNKRFANFQNYPHLNDPDHKSSALTLFKNVILKNKITSWVEIAINLKIHPLVNLEEIQVKNSITISSLLWRRMKPEQKEFIKKIGIYPKIEEQNLFEAIQISQELVIASNIFTYVILNLNVQLALQHPNIFGFAKLKEKEIDQSHRKQKQKIRIHLGQYQELLHFYRLFLTAEMSKAISNFERPFR